jgi:hypothetical protein
MFNVPLDLVRNVQRDYAEANCFAFAGRVVEINATAARPRIGNDRSHTISLVVPGLLGVVFDKGVANTTPKHSTIASRLPRLV